MTREERLELLKQIEKDIYVPSIESTFLDDAKSCAIHSVIEELEQEPTTKNDLGVENDLVSSIVEKISEQVTETHEEFIFETIRPYCENVMQMKISKRDLEQALLKYYGKNDLAVDCISRQAVLDLINADWKYENLEIKINNLPSVTPQEPILDKIRAEIIERDRNVKVVRGDGCCFFTADEVLAILDKYKAETENT